MAPPLQTVNPLHNGLCILQALTHAIYDLATYPEYILPLREEIMEVIEAEGWTKMAQGKMRKLDSFIKESQRLAAGSCKYKDSRYMQQLTTCTQYCSGDKPSRAQGLYIFQWHNCAIGNSPSICNTGNT